MRKTIIITIAIILIAIIVVVSTLLFPYREWGMLSFLISIMFSFGTTYIALHIINEK